MVLKNRNERNILCNIMENGFFEDIKFYLKAHHHVANPRALKEKKTKFISSQLDFRINGI